MFFVTPCFRIFFVALVVFDYWNASGEIILGDLSSRQIKQGEENDLKNYREHYIVKYHHNKSEIMIENDIVLSPTQYHESNQTRKKRFVMKNGKWPNGEIPYVISKELHSFASDIEEAIADYERETCLKFIDGASSENKVVIHAGEGCWSNLGFLRGEQWISLGSGCKSPGTVRHELGHTIGFHHTHDRPDRDQYVTIVTKNLMDGVSFDRVEEDQGLTYGIPYDYRSIMHYVSWACSKNGLNTIVTKDRKFQDIIGESDILSFRDIKTINLHYECAKSYTEKQLQYEEELKEVRQSRDEEVNQLLRDKFALTAKIKDSMSSATASSNVGVDEVGQKHLEKLEKELLEQEKLIQGYELENKRLYEEKKSSEKRSKLLEQEMVKETKRLMSEVSTLRSKLERQEEVLLHKGVASTITQQQTVFDKSSPTHDRDTAQLQDQLTQSKKRESALEREIVILRKNKQELEEHIERIIEEREKIHDKIMLCDNKDKELSKYRSENEQQSRKLAWYAENQRLLDSDSVTLKMKNDEISHLKSTIDHLQKEGDTKLFESKTWKREKSHDLKRIKDLERQVKEMELILKRRNPNSIAALMMTAATVPEGHVNEDRKNKLSATVLEERIQKLESELSERDEDCERKVRAIEQKYNSLKLLYETQIKDLKSESHDLNRPHTHSVALQKELDSVRSRYKEELSAAREEISSLKSSLESKHRKERNSTEIARYDALLNEKDSKIKALELQIAHGGHMESPVRNGNHTELQIDNKRLKMQIEQISLENDQNRVNLQKTLAETEARSRQNQENYEAEINRLTSYYEKAIQQLSDKQHSRELSETKVTELYSKMETQEVMLSHLGQQLSIQSKLNEELNQLRSNKVKLEEEISKLKFDLEDARSHQTPSMRHYELLKEKIIGLQRHHDNRENDIKNAMKVVRLSVQEEVEGEVQTWRHQYQKKTEEILRFRSELDCILTALKSLQQKGLR